MNPDTVRKLAKLRNDIRTIRDKTKEKHTFDALDDAIEFINLMIGN